MIDAKNEIQHIIVSRLLSGMAQEDFMIVDELAVAQRRGGDVGAAKKEVLDVATIKAICVLRA